MRKKEAGQAFILVLILLAIVALLVVPALRLSYTHLKSSQIVVQKTRSLYAASAAQEWVLWNLKQPAFANDFTLGIPKDYAIDVCGTSVNITIIMRAVEGTGGITLATNDVIRPTKTVKPEKVYDGRYRTYTYTIKLEQLSDNTSQGLDAIYDILPAGFKPASSQYVMGSSYLSVDGSPPEHILDPHIDTDQNQWILRWPAEGNFDLPIRDFAVRQVKELSFEITGTLPDDTLQYNWVVLKVGDIFTVSGSQAPITVGSPDKPEGAIFEVSKTSEPEIILPGVETDITYSINITNLDVNSHHIEEIADYLPPEFYYSTNSTSGLTTSDPIWGMENINGIDRQVLDWTVDEFPNGNHVQIGAGETLTLIFWVHTTKDVSGSYYNEVIMIPDVAVKSPRIFQNIGVPTSKYGNSYSWNAGRVTVLAYDSEVDADGTIIDANLSFVPGGIEFASWHIR